MSVVTHEGEEYFSDPCGPYDLRKFRIEVKHRGPANLPLHSCQLSPKFSMCICNHVWVVFEEDGGVLLETTGPEAEPVTLTWIRKE